MMRFTRKDGSERAIVTASMHLDNPLAMREALAENGITAIVEDVPIEARSTSHKLKACTIVAADEARVNHILDAIAAL